SAIYVQESGVRLILWPKCISAQALLEHKVEVQPDDSGSAEQQGSEREEDKKRGSESQQLRLAPEKEQGSQYQQRIGGDSEKVAEIHGAHEVAGLFLEDDTACGAGWVHGQ